MKPQVILGVIAASLVLGAVGGLILRSFAALAGVTVFSFAIISTVVFLAQEKKKREREAAYPAPGGKRPSQADVLGVNPDIASNTTEDYYDQDKVIRTFMENFSISRDKAENLYNAGYRRLGDFHEAIPEDLVLVEGINPTIARRIVSYVQSRR